jgi:hypothetical protein
MGLGSLVSLSKPVSNQLFKIQSRSMAYYSGNPLNRLSYLRSSPAFLTSALTDAKARFILLHQLNPLCGPPSSVDGTIKLCTVGWEDVKAYIGDPLLTFKYVDDKNKATTSVADMEAKLNSVSKAVRLPALS